MVQLAHIEQDHAPTRAQNPSKLRQNPRHVLFRDQIQHITVVQDIEGLIVFLASRASRYINGLTIPLDGGYIAAL